MLDASSDKWLQTLLGPLVPEERTSSKSFPAKSRVSPRRSPVEVTSSSFFHQLGLINRWWAPGSGPRSTVYRVVHTYVRFEGQRACSCESSSSPLAAVFVKKKKKNQFPQVWDESELDHKQQNIFFEPLIWYLSTQWRHSPSQPPHTLARR